MNKTKKLLPGLLLPLLLASAALAATVTVMVQQTQLRKRPQFYAPAASTVKLGQKLSTDSQQSGWYHVTSGGAEGWIHSSAVTAKAVKVGSGPAGGTGETTAEEVTLAGKGFNAQVESSYKDKHGDLNFAAVDRMEHRGLADAVLMAFLRAGGLIPAGARP